MNSYILRNKLTGQFFNGTSFSSEDIISADNPAQIFTGQPDEVAIRQIWGANTQIIVINDDQIATLKQSEEIKVRINAHRVAANNAPALKFAAPHEAAITRLRKRVSELVLSVYCDFPRCGYNS